MPAKTPDEKRSREPVKGRKLSPQEWEAVFARNLDHVRAFVRLRIDPVTRARESVADIVQSACREVLANKAFESRDETAFRSYLCQAALHKIQSHRRHYLADKRSPDHEVSASKVDEDLRRVYRTTMFDPLRKAIRSEEVLQLEAAFDQLPEQYREALTLYRIVGLPIAVLATRLSRTEGATKMLVNRALARLTSLLARPD